MLHSIGYDEKEQILEAEFTSGKVYQYFDVPKSVYKELMEASSHGRYFRSNVLGCYSDIQVRSR